MNTSFKITPDRDFLQHFLTNWRTKSISAEMVELLKENSGSDLYAAYGYGRWLSLVNPDGNSLKKAETLLAWAGSNGVQDANAALAIMNYDGRIESDEARHDIYAYLMQTSYAAGSELAQYQMLENLVYGGYGTQKNPALAADILKKHLDKNPGADTIYYDLLGDALETSDPEEAEKAYLTSIERSNIHGYFPLANFYLMRGEKEKAYSVAEEGARKGAVNCHRFKAMMEQDDFLALSPEEQNKLHNEIAEGLDYAIARYDSYACYLKGFLLHLGFLGYAENQEEALIPLERGCELGHSSCFYLKAYIHYYKGDALPPEMRASAADIARSCLQAVRMGDREMFTLGQVAYGYVSNMLSKYDDEIERLWLNEYVAAYPEEDGKDAAGVIAVYPRGFYYAMDVEEDTMDQVLPQMDYDIVHYSHALQRITKALGLDGESCHVAMLVDKNGYKGELPDNMTGTIIYGHGQEILGTVIFVLEDDETYRLKPFKGLQRMYCFIELLKAATGGLVRQPTSEELEYIGEDIGEDISEDIGGFEEYDDPEFYDDAETGDGEEQAIADGEKQAVEDEEPRQMTELEVRLREEIDNCNLCVDTLTLTLPDSSEYWFKSNADLIYNLGIKDAIEDNIVRHGGYMIDEWQFVDSRQIPFDIRSRIRFDFGGNQSS